MNCVLILVVIISVSQVHGGLLDQLPPNLVSSVSACASEKGVTPDQMLALSTLQSPSDTATQCFLACVAKQQGIMKIDNTFDRTTTVNAMKPLIDKLSTGKGVDATQVMNSIADSCTALPSSMEECAAAKKGFDCLVQSARMNGL